MSRPSSRKGSAKKGKGKEKKKTPKQIIKELTEQNEQLTIQLDTQSKECAEMKEKIDIVTKKLVQSVDKKEFGISQETNLSALTADVLLDIIDKLVVKRRIYTVSVEQRVDDVESRLTAISMDLAKMTKKTLALETGLDDIANCDSIEKVRDKIYELQLITGKALHTFEANDPIKPPNVAVLGYHEKKPSNTICRSLENAHLLNLGRPKKKLSGDTSILNMHKELRLYVMSELSLEKPSGCDWRRLAERVGIENETIEYWKSLNLEYPMGKVLTEWEKCPGSSVRMLHRHLVSPQMRCTLIAKRLADYYDVV